MVGHLRLHPLRSPTHTCTRAAPTGPPPPQSCGPELAEDDIRLVQSADGTSLGEAFVHFRGPRAKVRLALAKDRSVMPVRWVWCGGGWGGRAGGRQS